MQGAVSGQFQFVYATPEYLTTRTEAQLHELQAACNFCLVAMDEAHCIADMGRTFRPAFTRLHTLRAPGSALQHVPWIAVTATAGPAVQVRIQLYKLRPTNHACIAGAHASHSL